MRLILFFLLLGVIGCENGQQSPALPGLVVVYPVSLREAPGEESPELEQLRVGAILSDLNEVSRFVTGIYLGDTLRQEPWVRVQTKAGRQGWVFSGALRLAKNDTGLQRHWVFMKRFEAWFGPRLAARWEAWTEQEKPASDSTFAVFLRESLYLRDTLNLLIGRNVSKSPQESPPDFFWLSEMTPYFIVQQIMTGTNQYLFLDYRAVAKTAASTPGQQDDFFARAGIAAFPTDSIESALPAWVFPLNTEDSYSNLGEGKHLAVLKAIDRAMVEGNLFLPELLNLKEQVLDDILDKDRSYWQPQPKIMAELERIEKTPFKCLNGRDRLALKSRRNMFEQPGRNSLNLNLRAGD